MSSPLFSSPSQTCHFWSLSAIIPPPAPAAAASSLLLLLRLRLLHFQTCLSRGGALPEKFWLSGRDRRKQREGRERAHIPERLQGASPKDNNNKKKKKKKKEEEEEEEEEEEKKKKNDNNDN
ncbi:unnamed protein product [Pleuronectes platessa]|uniref:Uncharacterized protein n=1 Tax=Pleuronectes platessa TaxID=8262 RepID=A0A9N7V387_PLEPL|nr:unnamed protein product [Pleuronectes platessa]